MAKLIKLTHETLTELLDYDPATGVFTWKVARSNRVKVGSRAGVFHKPTGGRYIGIGDEKFMAHRLAWFYAKGSLPTQDIRPIDGNYDNCAIDNLKEISRIELQHARGANKNNTTGFAGVSPAPHGKFQAKITWNNIQVSLGMNFAKAEDAAEVVQKAQAELRKTTSPKQIEEVLETLRMQKRQRAAWAHLLRNDDPFTWNTFEEFCADVTDLQEHRYSMAPIDATKPMSKANYKWASQGHAKTGTPEGFLQYRRENVKANTDHIRSRRFKKEYGIDFAQYQQMLLAQNGVCAICEKPETKIENGTIRLLSVDHDHTTGEVRGLLCGNCNMSIGYACDDVSVLRKAIVYLESHKPADVLPFTPKVSEIDE